MEIDEKLGRRIHSSGGVAWHVEMVSKSTSSLNSLFFSCLMMRGEVLEVVSKLSLVGLKVATGALP